MTTEVTKQYFDNPFAANGNGNQGWNAGLGAAAGAVIGELFTQRRPGGVDGGAPGVTADQLDARFAALQAQGNADALQGHLGRVQEQIGRTSADSTIALGVGIASVKDAIVAGNAQVALGLCNTNHNITSGTAAVVQAVNAQGEAQKLLLVQQALDAERSRATELRIALSEQKNAAGHTATQVLLSQVISNTASSGNP